VFLSLANAGGAIPSVGAIVQLSPQSNDAPGNDRGDGGPSFRGADLIRHPTLSD
jgi:hypothetical protein